MVLLWCFGAISTVTNAFHVSKAFDPILLEAGTRVPLMLDNLISNLTEFPLPWSEASPPAPYTPTLNRRTPPISQARDPPSGKTLHNLEWDETCTDDQITTILDALGDAKMLCDAALQAAQDLKDTFDKVQNTLGGPKFTPELQGDMVLSMTPAIRKFWARNGPGAGFNWGKIVNDQVTLWTKIGSTFGPPRTVRLACNLGGTNDDGSPADDIQNGNDKDLCHDPNNPDNDAQAVSFVIDTAHNAQRTYVGINAPVINFCRDFFTLHGTKQPRPSDRQKQQEFEAQPQGQKKMDLGDLDTTARIVLHEWMHQTWTLNLNPKKDVIGFKNIAEGAGEPRNFYFSQKKLPDTWAWTGVWARWMKFKDINTCDLFPANA